MPVYDGTSLSRLSASVNHFTLFGVLHQPGRGSLAETPVGPGVHLSRWLGGTLTQMLAAAPEATSFWVTANGELVGHLRGAPDFVNEAFAALYRRAVCPRGRRYCWRNSAAGTNGHTRRAERGGRASDGRTAPLPAPGEPTSGDRGATTYVLRL